MDFIKKVIFKRSLCTTKLRKSPEPQPDTHRKDNTLHRTTYGTWDKGGSVGKSCRRRYRDGGVDVGMLYDCTSPYVHRRGAFTQEQIKPDAETLRRVLVQEAISEIFGL